MDAVFRVKRLSEEAVSGGNFVVAVSFDIRNAFNTVDWGGIFRGVVRHQVLGYLVRVIGSYFRGRDLEVAGPAGTYRRRIYWGVPQGSVLGPLLWNVAYNVVLDTELSPRVSLTCYADDTLHLATASSRQEALTTTESGVRRVPMTIESLGLEASLRKTEAIWFHPQRRKPPELNEYPEGAGPGQSELEIFRTDLGQWVKVHKPLPSHCSQGGNRSQCIGLT